jgi:arginase
MIAILGIPFDKNSSYARGAAQAPDAIRGEFYSDSSNLWTENGRDLSSKELLQDHGNAEIREFTDIEPSISRLLRSNVSPILLGGDHSITYPIVKAFVRRIGPLDILHFDAHPDLYEDFQGNRYSHASPFARIMEEKLANRLVQVGIRSANYLQRQQAEKYGVEMWQMKDIRPDIAFKFERPVYITVDMDALDPAFAPGVSHPEGGGLSTREVVSIIHSTQGKVVAADIVEFNPSCDPSRITAAACSKILKELAGKILQEE